MLLKELIFIIFLVFVSETYAQKINQFDVDMKRHGLWEKKYDRSEQIRYSGHFDHGNEVGVFNFYDKAGGHPRAVKTYTPGSTTLDVSFYTTQGKKVSEGKMKGKERVGEWTYYHQDGETVMSTESYVNGKKDGKRTVYYINGTKALEEIYKVDKREGLSIFYTDEEIILKTLTYKNDLLEGPAMFYDALGNLLKDGNYKKNKKHGIWKYYEDSKIVKEVKFPQNRIGVEH